MSVKKVCCTLFFSVFVVVVAVYFLCAFPVLIARGIALRSPMVWMIMNGEACMLLFS